MKLSPELAGRIICLVANKTDVKTALRQVSATEGKKLAEKYQCPHFAVSCKLGINVEKVVFEMVERMQKERRLLPQRKSTSLSSSSTLQEEKLSATQVKQRDTRYRNLRRSISVRMKAVCGRPTRPRAMEASISNTEESMRNVLEMMNSGTSTSNIEAREGNVEDMIQENKLKTIEIYERPADQRRRSMECWRSSKSGSVVVPSSASMWKRPENYGPNGNSYP
jgi:hypothetical protein